MPGVAHCRLTRWCAPRRDLRGRGPGDHPVRHPAAQGPSRHRGLERPGQGAARGARNQGARPGLAVITDVCLCEYTDHGHCGVVLGNDVDNDATLEKLARKALSHARAGADMVAPSDMMDGRVGAIRRRSTKTASAHSDHGVLGEVRFGLLRAVPRGRRVGAAIRRSPLLPDGSPQRRRGDARDRVGPGRGRRHRDGQARAAVSRPDLSRQAEFRMPVAAYNVSGEYSMLRAAGINGWLDEERAVMEVLTSIKRAGADMILSYFATEVAKRLRSRPRRSRRVRRSSALSA